MKNISHLQSIIVRIGIVIIVALIAACNTEQITDGSEPSNVVINLMAEPISILSEATTAIEVGTSNITVYAFLGESRDYTAPYFKAIGTMDSATGAISLDNTYYYPQTGSLTFVAVYQKNATTAPKLDSSGNINITSTGNIDEVVYKSIGTIGTKSKVAGKLNFKPLHAMVTLRTINVTTEKQSLCIKAGHFLYANEIETGQSTITYYFRPTDSVKLYASKEIVPDTEITVTEFDGKIEAAHSYTFTVSFNQDGVATVTSTSIEQWGTSAEPDFQALTINAGIYTNAISRIKLTDNESTLYFFDVAEGKTTNQLTLPVNVKEVELYAGKTLIDLDGMPTLSDGMLTVNIKVNIYGKGTEVEPYLMATAGDLSKVCDNLYAHYKQITDIDLDGVGNWMPIGGKNKYFNGIYDGGGYKIKNLVVDLTDTDCVGLFGNCREAILKNIHIDGGSVTGNSNVGGICGRGWQSSIIECTNTASITGNTSVGGICGINVGDNNITRCINTASITGGGFIGGICGASYSLSTITQCINTASVTGTGHYVGGICGQNFISLITTSYNTGNVKGTNEVGGICGQSDTGAIITASYNTGSVEGVIYIGGICGQNIGSTITASYNTGNMKGTNKVGRICGYNEKSSDIITCYCVGQSGIRIVGEGYADDIHLFCATYWPIPDMVGWGIDNWSSLGVWGGTTETSSYPKLYWE